MIDKDVVEKFAALSKENKSLRKANQELKEGVDQLMSEGYQLTDKHEKVGFGEQTKEASKGLESEIRQLEEEIQEVKKRLELYEISYQFLPNQQSKISDIVIDRFETTLEERVVKPAEEASRRESSGRPAQEASASNFLMSNISTTFFPSQKRKPARVKEESFKIEIHEEAENFDFLRDFE